MLHGTFSSFNYMASTIWRSRQSWVHDIGEAELRRCAGLREKPLKARLHKHLKAIADKERAGKEAALLEDKRRQEEEKAEQAERQNGANDQDVDILDTGEVEADEHGSPAEQQDTPELRV